MKLRILSLLIFSATFIHGSRVATAQIDVGTQAEDHNHRFEYWGTSLAWWGNEIGRESSNAQTREELSDLFFDPNNGLGMNFLRYNIGAGSNPDTSIQNITRPGAKMDGFVPDKPSDILDSDTWNYDFSADATQRLILDMAIDRGVTNIEAFANSAPWWLTRNESSSGADNGSSNLQNNRTGLFAEYMLEVVDYFENTEGIHFETLAPLNEPGSGFWRNGNGQEGMGVPVDPFPFQDRLIKEFGATIESRGTDIKLVGLEETSTRQSGNSWSNEALTDEAKAYIKQFNTHTYGFNGSSNQDDSERLFDIIDGDVKIYATEYGTGQGAGRLAEQIQKDIRYLDAAGWTYWQVLEDNNGSGWGLALANFNGRNDEYDIQDQYFAYKQFSAHIRPGSEIIELADDEANGNITAAYDPRTGQTVLVVNNQDDQTTSEGYSFNLDRDVDSTRLIRTTDENNSALTNSYQSIANATVNGNNVSFDSIGESVSTLVVNHRENLVRNGNFDLNGGANGATSIPNWEASGDAAFDTGSDHTFDVAGTGTAQLTTRPGATDGRIFQTGIGDADTDLTGVAFQLSADVRFLNAGSREYDADTYFALEFYGADDETLASVSLEDYQTEINPAPGVKNDGNNGNVEGSSDPNDNEYRTYVSGRFVAPEGTRYVRPVFKFDNLNDEANGFFTYFDNVRLQEVHPEAAAREWNVESGGTWSDNDNWTGNAAAARNVFAYFGNAIDEDSVVSVTDTQSVDGITFFSDHSYRLRVAGTDGVIEIGDAGSDEDAQIDVRWGDHRISTATIVMDDLMIQVLPDASLRIDNGFDANGFEIRKLGAGVVDFGLGFDLNGGTLAAYASEDATIILGADAILFGDYELLVAPGQILEFGDVFELATYSSRMSSFNSFLLPTLSDDLAWDVNYGSSSLTAAIVSAVPEPTSAVLFVAGTLALIGRRRRRTGLSV